MLKFRPPRRKPQYFSKAPPFYCSNDQPSHEPPGDQKCSFGNPTGLLWDFWITPISSWWLSLFYCSTNNVTPPYEIIHHFALGKEKWQSIKTEQMLQSMNYLASIVKFSTNRISMYHPRTKSSEISCSSISHQDQLRRLKSESTITNK